MAETRSQEIYEQVVQINRVTKVVKGGKNFSFSALVVVGERNGQAGYAMGKAREVPLAIKKAMARARRHMKHFSLVGSTIPHEAYGRNGGGRVFIRPASPGTGVIAGGAVRAVMEAVGVRDVLTKSLGSDNAINIVKAAFQALETLRSPREVAKLRGKQFEELDLAENVRNQLLSESEQEPTPGEGF
jgi:small subunit ribosomal protein S5